MFVETYSISSTTYWVIEHAWRLRAMDAFCTVLVHCIGIPRVTSESPHKWPLMVKFEVFFVVNQNEMLKEQGSGKLILSTQNNGMQLFTMP